MKNDWALVLSDGKYIRLQAAEVRPGDDIIAWGTAEEITDLFLSGPLATASRRD